MFRSQKKSAIVAASVLVAATFAGANQAHAAAWSFGVMSDTQWSTNNVDGRAQNPGTVAVGIINQLNTQFINKGVKFVLQVGDLDDKETNYSGLPSSPRLGISTRAAAAQGLYDAGIGFYPLRGNHEGSQIAAGEVQSYFPQTTGGTHNVPGVSNFSSPSTNLNGLSYSFDYNNARFVLLDQFTPTDGLASDGTTYSQGNNAIGSQQGWISSTLSSKAANNHAFVFSHKQLFGGNHTDTLFGKADQNPDAQNAFISSLDTNNVGYLFTGHDHMHNRSVVTSPDGTAKVNQVIAASDSYKFYTPSALAGHGTDTVGPNAGLISKNRETQISQELWSTGYYIVSIDGPRAKVDFYSADPVPSTPGLEDVDLAVAVPMTFSKRETFGYSLNGKQFLLPTGADLSVVQDAIAADSDFRGTSVKLGGTVGTTVTDYNGRSTFLDVNTGWSPAEAGVASDVLSLWGMTNVIGSDQTDTFLLTLSYDPTLVSAEDLATPSFGVRTRNSAGEWVLAGSSYVGNIDPSTLAIGAGTLGQYGYNTADNTVWAVVNHNSDFAAAVPEPTALSLIGVAALLGLRRRRSL